MKLAKTKIIAAAMAALTTICASQSLSASALTAGQYTMHSQTKCEEHPG